MSRRTSKASSSREKLNSPSKMTVRHKKDVIDKNYFADPRSSARKNSWPPIEPRTASRDFNADSRSTSFSWPEEIEEAATQKILNLWHAVERTLYEENNDEEVPPGPVMDECIQWRSQIPHLRVVGKSMTIKMEDEDSDKISVVGKNNCGKDKSTDEVAPDDDLQQLKEPPKPPLDPHLLHEKKEQVIDRIMEYICAELEKAADEEKNAIETEENLSHDLDDVLKISPAPMHNGQRNGRINGRKSSANVFKSFKLTDQSINSTALLRARQKNAKDANHDSINNYYNNDDDDDDDEEEDEYDEDDDDNDVQVDPKVVDKVEAQRTRNKLGTVFNKKIVVSPVPFSVSTRESFCTLQTTPIGYAGHLLELSPPRGFGRALNSASKAQYKRKSPLIGQQRHSAWQAPVCPAVWPKNIRLAPIDPARLPSGTKKKSSLAKSPPPLTAPPPRGRNSLSPIMHPSRATTGSSLNGRDDFLEIQGKQITSRSAKLEHLKTGWDLDPRDERNSKKMSRNKMGR